MHKSIVIGKLTLSMGSVAHAVDVPAIGTRNFGTYLKYLAYQSSF